MTCVFTANTIMMLCTCMCQAEGEESVLVAGDPERQHMKLCEEKGGIPYHPNQIQFGVSTYAFTAISVSTHCKQKEQTSSNVAPSVEPAK